MKRTSSHDHIFNNVIHSLGDAQRSFDGRTDLKWRDEDQDAEHREHQNMKFISELVQVVT